MFGSNCYMNATLQCFGHIEKLTKFLLNPEQINQILLNKNKYKLINSYTNLLQNLWLNNKIKYYTPNDFKNIINNINPLFVSMNTNNSQDLVVFLMDEIHNELNTSNININQFQFKIQNQLDYEITLELLKDFYNKNYKLLISNIFYGIYNSNVKCLNCNVMIHDIQYFNMMIFPLKEVIKFKKRKTNKIDIIECFEYYQKEYYMMGENQIYCNKCQKMSNIQNFTKLIIGPNVLVIYLNREKGLKNPIKISFKEYLDIKNFVYYKDISPSFYELVGIVTYFEQFKFDNKK